MLVMTEPTTEAAEIRDFTLPRVPHQFRIDDDLFSAPAVVSPITLARVAAQHKALAPMLEANDIEGVLRAVADMFRKLMPGESGRRFAVRLLTDGNEVDVSATAAALGVTPSELANITPDPEQVIYLQPLDLQRQALPALFYLMECYGLRPTQQSSLSPSGSKTGALTDGAPLAESTGEQSATQLDF